MSSDSALQDQLRAAGVQPTARRLALARLLFVGEPHHFTAEQLWERARAANVPVSLATVYNTLSQFVDAGLLAVAQVGSDRTCYDTNTTHHHHVVDEGSGAVSDLPEGAIRTTVAAGCLPAGTRVASVDVVVRVRRVP